MKLTSDGYPIQNIVSFHVSSSIVGGWVDIRCVKTKRLVRSKPFQDVIELEAIKEQVIMQVMSETIKRELGLCD